MTPSNMIYPQYRVPTYWLTFPVWGILSYTEIASTQVADHYHSSPFATETMSAKKQATVFSYLASTSAVESIASACVFTQANLAAALSPSVGLANCVTAGTLPAISASALAVSLEQSE